MIGRRQFIAGLGSAAAWPVVAPRQGGGKRRPVMSWLCRTSCSLRTRDVRSPLQGRDGKRRPFEGADPAGGGKSARYVERIGFAPTVSYDQGHILVDWSRIDRLPPKSFREHARSLARQRIAIERAESRLRCSMAPFLFRCPNTGFRVQGWVADDGSDDAPGG